jgi:hypothetical protein
MQRRREALALPLHVFGLWVACTSLVRAVCFCAAELGAPAAQPAAKIIAALANMTTDEGHLRCPEAMTFRTIGLIRSIG